jgi:hypothetical protein
MGAAGFRHDQKNRTCRYLVSAPEARVARVARVLGAGPFCEIGRPRVVKTSPDGTLIVVGGELAWPQWHGHDLARRSRPNPGWYPVAVYRSDDFTCLYQFTARWPANAIFFHPTLPLVAIGTGSYDGGWAYEGELLLLDLTTGTVVSLMAHRREVRRITWRDPETLDLVLAVPCDEDKERFGTTSLACSIRRGDWDRATDGMLRMPYSEEPVPEEPQTDPALATTILEQLCQEHGQMWVPRLAVWAVHALPTVGSSPRWKESAWSVGRECPGSRCGGYRPVARATR